MPKPRIMFWHDGRHPLAYMYEPPMQREEYESAVDELVGTPVEAIVFGLGDGRTMLHDTKVGELWRHDAEGWERAGRNAKALIDEGNDPLRIICERAHEKGMLIYPSLFAQQSTKFGGTRVSNFRLQNRHLEIGAAAELDGSLEHWEGLDYKHEEVRDERFELIDETLNSYDVDGFELHLVRSPRFFYYFHPNEIDAGRVIMTEWVGKIYEAVKTSGTERELAIKIPTSIDACMSQGLDIREWIKLGIIDVINAEDTETGNVANPSSDFRELVAAVEGSECRIHASIRSHLDSDRVNEATIETLRAVATNFWDQGIDGLYVDHWFSQWPYQAPFYEKLRELPYPDVMAPKDKIYHVPTETGRAPPSADGAGAYVAAQRARSRNPLQSAGPNVIDRLPVGLDVGKPATVQITISDDLPRWDRAGRVHEVLLRVRVSEATELDRLSFKLNGRELPDSLRRTINRMYLMNSPRFRVFGYWYVFRLDRDRWPVKGANSLEVTLHERDPDVTPQISLRDVELETRYLMGMNYHRDFVDTDLGPYEKVTN